MRRYKNNSYYTVSAIGDVIRNCYLANAFDYYFGTEGINGLIALLVSATVGEFLLSRTSYMAVGLIYNIGDAPTLGSILYTIFYIINNLIMIGICWICSFLNLDLLLVLIFYIVIWIVLAFSLNRIKGKDFDF